MTIGQKIDALIEDADISIKELADYLNVSTKQITRWRRDESEIGAHKLAGICTYFGVSADYILGLPRHSKWPR